MWTCVVSTTPGFGGSETVACLYFIVLVVAASLQDNDADTGGVTRIFARNGIRNRV